jgi:hypothetical protein
MSVSELTSETDEEEDDDPVVRAIVDETIQTCAEIASTREEYCECLRRMANLLLTADDLKHITKH